jgi:hypothetical protein
LLARFVNQPANDAHNGVVPIVPRSGCETIKNAIENAWLATDFEAGPLDDLIGH